uniref:Uncharacterized protein n=1 Tax=Nelumbo nucifera TaxID=4432 RepID=A0A822YJ72_NELNU|nr:TPA_asm: hypothetical protein HUJ06_009876 [Nelumbo nucifera]
MHSYMREIILYVTTTYAKCVSIDDTCVERSGQSSDHGKRKYIVESEGDCCIIDFVSDDDASEHECGHGMEGADGEFDEDQNCGDGLGGDDDWLGGGIGDSDSEQSGGFGVPSTGHDGLGVSSVKEAVDLSDYEPLSDNDNLERGGVGPLDFDFSNPRFLVGMEFATVKGGCPSFHRFKVES